MQRYSAMIAVLSVLMLSANIAPWFGPLIVSMAGVVIAYALYQRQRATDRATTGLLFTVALGGFAYSYMGFTLLLGALGFVMVGAYSFNPILAAAGVGAGTAFVLSFHVGTNGSYGFVASIIGAILSVIYVAL